MSDKRVPPLTGAVRVGDTAPARLLGEEEVEEMTEPKTKKKRQPKETKK